MIKYIVIIAMLAVPGLVHAQSINIGAGAVTTIGTGASLNAFGLEMSPSADYIISDNVISLSSTPVFVSGGKESILRVYEMANPLAAYSGSLILNYEDDELNGGTETLLDIEIENSSTWTAYASTVNAVLNTITLDADLSGVTMDRVTAAPFDPCSDSAVWTALGWDISPMVPTISTNVTIMADFDTSAVGFNIDACQVTVNTGVSLTIGTGAYLRVANNITVNGTLNVAHTANVVQIDNDATVTNNGTINVFVDTPELDGRDFMVLGSPMSMETRAGVFASALRVRNHLTGNFSPNTDVGMGSPGAGNWVDEEGDDWPVYMGSAINPGEGYMVMRDLLGPPTALNLTFDTGTLNNGVINYSAGYNGSQNASPNIIANPYASAISATDFINTNTGVVDAVYFWEHVTTPNSGIPGPYALDYTMEDISIFNLTGGTAAAGSDPSTTPTGLISTGQGFGVKVISAGGPVPLTFNNAMRRITGNTTLRNQDLDRVWLNVQSEGYELNSTALIGFLDEATNGIDLGYDAKRLATNVSLYSHLDDGSDMLGIQARGAFEENVKIPMGFATLIDENMGYTISIQNIEGLNLGTATAYLIDTFKNEITNLSESDYTFMSEKGIYDNRFTLQFTPEVVLGTGDADLETISLYPNPTQNTVTIVSPKSIVTGVRVFDIGGRIVSEVDFRNRTSYQIDVSSLEVAVYFIEIATENGTVTKRLMKK